MFASADAINTHFNILHARLDQPGGDLGRNQGSVGGDSEVDAPLVGMLDDRPKVLADQRLAARDGQKRHARLGQFVNDAEFLPQAEFVRRRFCGSHLHNNAGTRGCRLGSGSRR